jgi:hypothetical protein
MTRMVIASGNENLPVCSLGRWGLVATIVGRALILIVLTSDDGLIPVPPMRRRSFAALVVGTAFMWIVLSSDAALFPVPPMLQRSSAATVVRCPPPSQIFITVLRVARLLPRRMVWFDGPSTTAGVCGVRSIGCSGGGPETAHDVFEKSHA